MRKYENAAFNNSSGLPIANPTITVYHAGTTTIATIYSDEGTTPKSNPFTGDAYGRFWFYAPDGDYDAKIEGAGVTPYTIADITLADSKRGGFAITNDRVIVLLANAWYKRETGEFLRLDVAKDAYMVEADLGTDAVTIYRKGAGANPISAWDKIAQFTGPDAAVNYIQVLAVITGSGVEVKALGSDTDIDLILRPKGAGIARVITGLEVQEVLRFSGDISPPQITATQNDYNPTGLATASCLRLTSDSANNITGIQGGADGRILIVQNVGGINIPILTLKKEDVGSAAANRFAISADIVLNQDEGCTLRYDGTSTRWRRM